MFTKSFQNLSGDYNIHNRLKLNGYDMIEIMVPKYLIIDVDGVLTSGQFFYSEEGKVMKVFGPDDNDALALLKPFLKIHFISGDKRGFSISKKRIVDDMNYPLDLVSTVQRVKWIQSHYKLSETIYIGDGIFDYLVFQQVGYGIAPSNADDTTKTYADYVTTCSGGNRAVSESCLHILKTFFNIEHHKNTDNLTQHIQTEWTV